MNFSKKINGLFLVSILLSVFGTIFFSILATGSITVPIWLNLIISQGMIILPVLFFILLNPGSFKDMFPFRKIRIWNVFLLMVFCELLMPLVNFVNVFSQLFTENEVLSISSEVLKLPLPVMIFLIGILGPFCEEFVFRGAIFFGLRSFSQRIIASALVSAMFFGLMHMNVNQCCYAFVLGLIFALVDEIFESLWPSFIMHALVNSQNVIMLYIVNYALTITGQKELTEMYNTSTSKGMIALMAFIFFVIAIFTTFLAGLLLLGMISIEKKSDKIKDLFKPAESREKVLTVCGYIGIAISVFMMFGTDFLKNLIIKISG